MFSPLEDTTTSPNARLTRRFGAAKRRKIGHCAADCFVLLAMLDCVENLRPIHMGIA